MNKAQQTGDWSEVLSMVESSQRRNHISRQRVNPIRTTEEIFRDVLEGCKRPILQSRLSTRANISSTPMFRRYTDPLIERCLLSLSIRRVRKTEREFFHITPDGQRTLWFLEEHLEAVSKGINVLDDVLALIDNG